MYTRKVGITLDTIFIERRVGTLIDIAASIIHGSCIIATDGSYVKELDNASGASWIIESGNGTSRLEGDNLPTGNKSTQCPYRSELFGIHGALLHIHNTSERFNITKIDFENQSLALFDTYFWPFNKSHKKSNPFL